MMLLRTTALAAAGFCLLAWMYLLIGRGWFWRVRRLEDEVAPAAVNGLIAVVIPARNEGATIGKSVTSLLQQSCADSIRIFVVDDDSADGTGTLARAAAL